MHFTLGLEFLETALKIYITHLMNNPEPQRLPKKLRKGRMSPKQCSQHRDNVKDVAIAGPDPNLGFYSGTTTQVRERESKVLTHHSDAFKKGKQCPRSSLTPIKDGHAFHLKHCARASLPTGMRHTIYVCSLRHHHNTSQKKPPCRAPPHHGQKRPTPPHLAPTATNNITMAPSNR